MNYFGKAYVLTLSLTVFAILSLCQLALAQQQKDMHSVDDEAKIAFTEVPSMLGHTSNTCERAMTLRGPLEFRTQILHTGITHYGTQFVKWLRDGHTAIVSRIALAPGSCPNVSDCACEPELSHVHIVPFVVDMQTRDVVLKLTQSFPNSDNLYADAGPVYPDNNSTNVAGYLVGIHDVHENSTQMYRLDAEGSNPQPVPIPQAAKAHGCQLSPKGPQLACEVPAVSPSPNYVRFCLTDLSGSPCTFIQKDNERIILGFAVWSPDGSGFVYYSEDDGRAQLMYYKLGETPVALGPQWTNTSKWTPSFACNDSRFSRPFTCKFYGGLGSNIGSDVPAWSKNGDYVYFSTVNLAEEAPFHRYLARIPIRHADRIEILTPNFDGEPGHPAASPDGSSVIFTSPASPFDPRTEVFRVNVKERKPTRLTHLPASSQAYALHWWE